MHGTWASTFADEANSEVGVGSLYRSAPILFLTVRSQRIEPYRNLRNGEFWLQTCCSSEQSQRTNLRTIHLRKILVRVLQILSALSPGIPLRLEFDDDRRY
jgi:hypothetical protein